MTVHDLRKFLDKFEGCEIRLEGFPPQVVNIEIRYDAPTNRLLISPVFKRDSILIGA